MWKKVPWIEALTTTTHIRVRYILELSLMCVSISSKVLLTTDKVDHAFLVRSLEPKNIFVSLSRSLE
jgi:hypothetical protein